MVGWVAVAVASTSSQQDSVKINYSNAGWLHQGVGYTNVFKGKNTRFETNDVGSVVIVKITSFFGLLSILCLVGLHRHCVLYL